MSDVPPDDVDSRLRDEAEAAQRGRDSEPEAAPDEPRPGATAAAEQAAGDDPSDLRATARSAAAALVDLHLAVTDLTVDAAQEALTRAAGVSGNERVAAAARRAADETGRVGGAYTRALRSFLGR